MATWIPEKERDHRYGVFIRTFMIRIPYIHTRTKEDLREYGMPSSGFKEFDTGAEHELVDRYVSINDMLELYLNGVDIRVVPYEKTADIYEEISNYLNYWLLHIRTTFSTNHVPVKDLQDLDTFANVVYDKAKYQFTNSIIDDAMMRAVNDVSMVNYDNIIAPSKPTVTHVNHKGFTKAEVVDEEEEPEDPYPQRQGMMEMFKTVRARRIERN